MVDINNLTGLEKPLTKLIETMSEAVGVVGNDFFKFDARKIKRIGEAEAEADKQKIIREAEGQAKALAILDRAGKRFALEQYNRQINLENIIFQSKQYLEGMEVSDKPVDKDWTSRFMGVAQEVSKEEVQDLLARILAGEIRNPNSYSVRTLEVLKNISKNELETFKKFIALSTTIGFAYLSRSIDAKKIKKYGVDFEEFINLSDIGLFNPSTTLSWNIEIENSSTFLYLDKQIWTITPITNNKILTLGVLKFTNIGLQLYHLLSEN